MYTHKYNFSCSNVFLKNLALTALFGVKSDYYGKLLTYSNLRIADFLMSRKILTGSYSSGFTCTWVFLPFPQETTLFSPHLDRKSRDIKTRKHTIKSSSLISKPGNFWTDIMEGRNWACFSVWCEYIFYIWQYNVISKLSLFYDHDSTALGFLLLLFEHYFSLKVLNWLRKQK